MIQQKALILTWDGFQDQEVIYPYYRLQEEGFETHVISNHQAGEKVKGIFGIELPNSYNLQYMHLIAPDYSLLVIPGGVKALEKLRQEKYILNNIWHWNNQGKIISSTCHGAQMLISARIVKDRKISGYYSIKDDIENAGAIYVDEPVVVDKNIISSPHYKHMGPWMKVTIEEHKTLTLK